MRPRSHERSAENVRLHLLPALGRTRLTRLRPDARQELYAAKRRQGLAPRTVHHVHTVLHTALEQAVRWGYLPRNVADVVTRPAVPQREPRWPRGEVVRRLLAAAGGDRLQALWALAAYTGCRLGELCGLTWEDVDLTPGAAGRLHVRRILVDVRDSAPVYGEPKTRRSRRAVPLSAEAVAALRAHRDRQRFERDQLGDDYGAYGLVFATHFGTPLQRKVVQPQFKRALARAGLPAAIRFHDLRHTAATLMLAGGVDVPADAAILGHSQNSTTLNIYAHALPDALSAATDALARALRGAP